MNEIRLITEDLLDELVNAMANATSICFIVSFAASSGISLMITHMQQALMRGAEVKILVGDYLYITEPAALEGLLQLGSDAEIRLWQSHGRSFHPKAYLLQSEDDDGILFVGSSNLSRSALTHGVEWNLAVEASVAPLTFATARQKFMASFYDPCTLPVTLQSIVHYRELYTQFHTEHPQLYDTWKKLESTYQHIPSQQPHPVVTETAAIYETIHPRPAQIEALAELKRTMEEGYNKAMVVMATGLGKTYLSAFIARQFKRVLFVAHREEILHQASRSFQEVMPERSVGLYNGHTKSKTSDTVMASIFTLAMKRHREAFAPDDFDLIIIDEFHHAAARSYRNLLDYFQPEFLLGITATPERSDGQDIFGLCDGNVAYQIRFLEAIERGWLAPFHYYGVYDEIDYKTISWLGTHYDEEELYAAQIQFNMADRVIEAWQQHRGTRTLAFCSSIRQSEYLARKFAAHGIRATSLHSQSVGLSRQEAIRRLSEGTIDILCTVDLFNEGVDIPSVDTVLLVRPTESLTVFIQQIGRGLRLHPGKSHCTIIDLIGNYRNADITLRVFDTAIKDTAYRQFSLLQNALPSQCIMELDIRVVHLLQEMARKRLPRHESVKAAYMTLKMELGRRPTYLDFHLFGSADSQTIRQEFHSYIGFLSWLNELTHTEQNIYTRYSEWLHEVEITTMTRSYKMVLLSYLLSRGSLHWSEPIVPKQVAHYFHSYLSAKEYRKNIDLSNDVREYNEEKMMKLIARMPMSKWAGSSKGWVHFEDGRFHIRIDDEPDVLTVLHEWTQQICDYRLHTYFERKQR